MLKILLYLINKNSIFCGKFFICYKIILLFLKSTEKKLNFLNELFSKRSLHPLIN